MKTIYELELHESQIVNDVNLAVQVLRVAGGWIYQSFDKSHNIFSSVFVPFHNEFQLTQPKEE